MKYDDMSKYIKLKFRNSKKQCYYCGKELSLLDDIEWSTQKISKYKMYHFYHVKCADLRQKKMIDLMKWNNWEAVI